MKLLDLGKLDGRLLLFGGVYSNLQALERLLEVAKEEQISSDRMICTGDLVAYCAQPNECIELIADLGIRSILGNVEIQLRDGETDCGCNFHEGSSCDLYSRHWYPFAQKTVHQRSLDFLATLPDHIRFTFAGKRCVVVHGSYFETSGFVFRSTPWQVKQENFEAAQADVVIAGHCGLPFNQSENGLLWLNPGVIGMPANDGTPRVWYMIMEEVNGEIRFEHRSLNYNHEMTMELMEKQNLPKAYMKTLASGIWDNCEILPPQETALQGIPLI